MSIAIGSHVTVPTVGDRKKGTVVEIDWNYHEGAHCRPVKVLIKNGLHPIYMWWAWREVKEINDNQPR